MSIGVLTQQSTKWTRLPIVISPVRSSKFLSPRLTADPVGTLATTRTENSRSDFWAMLMVVADTDMSGSVVGGVAEEVEARLLLL
jgi:hypothetical protein